ncbi:MAG: Mur ligase family protein, partial [Bdellovibrionota bacterium]
MRVQELLALLPSVKTGDSSSAEVSGLVFDSRKIEPGCVFVAIRGGKADGHAFLGEAEAKRAAAIVVEDASRVPSTFRGHVAVVQDSREALNRLAARYFGEPAKNLFCVGVTGTNGKTTTTYMIEAIFEAGGIPAGVIGTRDHHFRGNVWKTEMTTPDPLAFQERLSQFVQHGAKAVALE